MCNMAIYVCLLQSGILIMILLFIIICMHIYIYMGQHSTLKIYNTYLTYYIYIYSADVIAASKILIANGSLGTLVN